MAMQDRKKYSELRNGKLSVEVEYDGYDDYLFVSNNGFQRTGTPITKQTAIMIIAALSEALANGGIK